MTSTVGLRVGAGQLMAAADHEVMRAQVRECLDDARDQGVDLLVLPEYSHYYDPRGVPAHAAEPLDGPFVQLLARWTADASVTVVAGLTRPAHRHPVNTLVVVAEGAVQATYDKVHLYDAFGYRESDHLEQGDVAQEGVFSVGEFSVGLQTCYDLRFPELTRRRIDAGADIVVNPAAWVAGPNKLHHWRTLLAARAIENTVVMVGAALDGRGVCGDTRIVFPDGTTAVGAAHERHVVSVEVTRTLIADARERNPSLSNRVY